MHSNVIDAPLYTYVVQALQDPPLCSCTHTWYIV